MLTFMIDKILSYTSVSDKSKIDRLLELDATLYCNLGSDSTKAEKRDTRTQSKLIYKAIKSIDKRLGDQFLQHMDK